MRQLGVPGVATTHFLPLVMISDAAGTRAAQTMWLQVEASILKRPEHFRGNHIKRMQRVA